MALMGTLTDDFLSTHLDSSIWNHIDDAGAFSFQAGGQYNFIVNSEVSATTSLRTVNPYDLTESHLYVNLADNGVPDPNYFTFPIIISESATDLNNSIYVEINNGTVNINVVVASVTTTVVSFPFNAQSMKWWRIRESATITYIETAPAYTGRWTVRASGPAAIPITALYVWIGSNVDSPLPTAKYMAITNVNFAPAPTLPFPNGAIGVGAEIAFGANLSGDQSLWPWINITPPDEQSFLMAQTIATTRGRPDESGDVVPTAASILLDNPFGDFTPNNPQSQYYPNVRLGTPARMWVENLTPRLSVRPTFLSNAQVASTPALDITTDLDVRIDMQLYSTDPNGANTVVVGRANDTTTYSWRIIVNPDHTVQLLWSPTGTPPPMSVTSSVPVVPSSARSTLRAALLVNNGSGAYEAAFYTGPSVNGPFFQVGPIITGTAITSIDNAAQPLTIGSELGTTVGQPLDADVYRLQVRNGINGTVIVDANFEAQTSGVPSFVDSTGLVWTINRDASLYNRWYRIVGTIDQWEPTWPYGDLSSQQPGGLSTGEARVQIGISGILRRLGQGQPPLFSALRRSIEDEPSLRAYWPMEDSVNATQIASALPDGPPILVAGGITFAADSLVPGSNPLPKIGPGTYFSGPVSGAFTDRYQIDWFMMLPLASVSTGTWSVIRITTYGTVRTWEIRINSMNMGVFGFDASGSVVVNTVVTIHSFFDLALHNSFYVRDNGGGSLTWTFAWGEVTYPPRIPITLTGSYTGVVGNVISVGITPGVGIQNMIMGHIAVFDSQGVDTIGNAATGWPQETALARIERLCAEENIPLRVIGQASDTPPMGPQPSDTLFNILDQCKDVDDGILYEQKYLIGLIYRTRTSLYNQPYNLTLDGLSREIANPLSPILDDQRIRNIVTVGRDNGSSTTVKSQESIDDVGQYTDSVSFNFYSDSQTVDAAGWRLHQGTFPFMRNPQVTTNLGVSPQKIDDWLTVDIGARVQLINLPPQHPDEPMKLLVESFTESISPNSWIATMTTSPATLWNVYELSGDSVSDEYLFRLETDGSQLFNAVGPTDTTFNVQITSGPLWVTDPSQFPFYINIGGEQMQVTAIAAAVGDVQEFSVVRSINGVIKFQSFGSPVTLWYKPVLAR